MAAMYQDIGYHRVLIKKILSKKRVSVLYLNSGTEIDISVKNLREAAQNMFFLRYNFL